MNKEVKNYGFNPRKELQDRQVSDLIFGADSPECMTHGIDLRKYLPEGEVQRGAEDMMDCATRAIINIAETKFTALVKEKKFCEENIRWLKVKGYSDDDGNVTFSDAFIAIKSGTTRQGNSLKAPTDCVYRYGLIPKRFMPLEKTMTWGQYHDPKRITKEMNDLGLEFKAIFPIAYDIVYRNKYPEFIKKEMLDTAVYAWPNPINGIYPRVRYPFNHAIAIFPPLEWEAFDNYIDTFDGDYIKRLAPDYNLLEYSYRLIINEVVQEKPQEEKKMKFYKKKDTPNIYIRGVGDNLYHRIADENTFTRLFGEFSNNQIEELDIAESFIGEPVYLSGSMLKTIVIFFSQLKGSK